MLIEFVLFRVFRKFVLLEFAFPAHLERRLLTRAVVLHLLIRAYPINYASASHTLFTGLQTSEIGRNYPKRGRELILVRAGAPITEAPWGAENPKSTGVLCIYRHCSPCHFACHFACHFFSRPVAKFIAKVWAERRKFVSDRVFRSVGGRTSAWHLIALWSDLNLFPHKILNN